jgi:hypothetical protein
MKNAGVLLVVAALAACGSSDPGGPGNSGDRHIAGSVRGMWTGADGVALRLTTDHVDTLLTATANGGFQFPAGVSTGDSYVVTIANQPFEHTCVVARGGNGVVGDADAMLDVACTGPVSSIRIEGNDFAFDATVDQQPALVSALATDASIVIDALPGVTATLDGAPLSLSAPIPRSFALGQTVLSLAFAAGGLSRTYELDVDRGGAPLAQATYVKAVDSGAHPGVGAAVALDGDTLVVGAAHAPSTEAGAVYVFVRAHGAWSQQARIDPSGDPSPATFGTRVAISGEALVVSSQTLVYSYQRVNGAWILAQAFGYGALPVGGLALRGDLLVIGFPTYSSAVPTSGLAVIYRRTSGTYSTFGEVVELQAGTPLSNQQFGAAVAIDAFDGKTIAIGAPDQADAGNAAVHLLRAQDATWSYGQIIPSPSASPALAAPSRWPATR